MGANPPKDRILIVDDNEFNLEVLSRRLLKRGYHVTTADNGEKALAKIKSEDYDTVLLDVVMPGMTGLEVLAEARKTFSKTSLPIIMVTSKSESQDVVEALNKGANDYIVKPVDFPVALARIQTQISQKHEFSSFSKAKPNYQLAAGDRFANYILEEKIGHGGMGAVFKARDKTLQRIVALKVILPGHELSKAQTDRFTREARAIAQIKHPNIITVYDIGEDPQYFFTMDFIEGANLSSRIREGGMDIVDSLRMCIKIANALHAAHGKGVIHRDLKPSNIMVDTDDEPYLMDFGLAKLESEEEQITRTGDLLGTPEYMAPEQVDATFGETSNLSDIYALGAILYEMMTGRAPFSGTPIRILWQKLNEMPASPSSVNEAVPVALDPICERAMARPPGDRFASAHELGDALRHVLESLEE